jgi:hypothetical protein
MNISLIGWKHFIIALYMDEKRGISILMRDGYASPSFFPSISKKKARKLFIHLQERLWMNEWLVGYLCLVPNFWKNYQELAMFLERTGKEPDDSEEVSSLDFAEHHSYGRKIRCGISFLWSSYIGCKHWFFWDKFWAFFFFFFDKTIGKFNFLKCKFH